MKLHQLEALIHAVDGGSIRGAARVMNLTQAALTKSLRLLEAEAGVAILVRSSHGVALTAAGQRLLQRARLITHQIMLASEELRHTLGDEDGVVCIGLTPFLTLTVLGDAFNAFRARYKRMRVHVSEGLVSRVLPALRDGSIDFALVADTGDVPSKEFAALRLASHSQKIVARKGNPILKNATAAALAQCEWLMPGTPSDNVRNSDGGGDATLAAMFAKVGLSPPAMVTRTDAMAGIALVRNSDLISIFPARLLAEPESRNIVEVPVPALKPPDIKLVHLALADVPLTPAAAHFSRCLIDASAAG